MIKGITNDESGQPIQRLAVSTKVAIGLPPDPSKGRKAPMKLDCFLFLRKSSSAQNAWEMDPNLTKVYGNKCKEFEIVLLDDDLENVFPTKLAWFTASECKCFGDGESATRRTAEHPDGQPWSPCGKACPDFQRGDCKPSGDLRFMLAAFPQLGAVARIHTSSYRSIIQISSSLQQIQTITGGRLAGIRCKLVVRPEKTSYADANGKKHSTTIYALNLEIQAEGIKELIGRMTDHARLFEQTRKMLGTGRIEVMEPDNDRSEEIQAEFYPASNISPAQFPKPDDTEEYVESKEQPNMLVACASCGQVNGHASDCGKTQSKSKKSGPAVQEKPKDSPAMCVECREIGKHKPDCKFAVAPKPEEPAAPGNLNVVCMLTKTEKKKKKDGTEFLMLSVIIDNKDGKLYVWHDHLKPLFPADSPKAMIMQAEVSKQLTADKKEYFAVEHLLELGGKIFVNDKPAEGAEAPTELFA